MQRNGFNKKGFSGPAEYFEIMSEKVNFVLAGGGSTPFPQNMYPKKLIFLRPPLLEIRKRKKVIGQMAYRKT